MLSRLINMSRTGKRALQVVLDASLLLGSFGLAMWLRLDQFEFLRQPGVWLAIVPVVPLSLLVFHGLGLYRAVVRYIAVGDLLTVLVGVVVSGAFLAVLSQVAGLPVPRAVPLIYMALVLLSLGGVRFGFRELVLNSQNRRKKPVVIYGAGASGRQLVQLLRQGSEYLPVAFVDDSAAAQGTLIAGLRVHSPTQMAELIASEGVEVVLLALPSASKRRRSEILKSLEDFPLHLRTIPGLDELVSNKARIDDLNEIGIEDLLGRDPIEPRADLLSANIHDKVVMVTGAGGSIGSELCRQILRQVPRVLVLFEQSELALYSIEQELAAYRHLKGLKVQICPVLGSVQSADRVARTLRNFKVQTVYHAAAYKHVPLVEDNVVEGIRNNVHGTLTVAEGAIAAGVESFILISTDKAVRPTNVMGASKRFAEMICQTLATSQSRTGTNVGTKLSMVRFGNVLGSSGSVIPLFQRQIAAGGPITVTHPDITRFFMTIPEAAQLVIQAGAMAQGGDVFVLDMGEPVRIADLAAQMARLHGLKPVPFHDAQRITVGPGEIAILFTRLRPGEKLYEELLISNDPKRTAHPRIMTATDLCMGASDLMAALRRLTAACDAGDVDRVRAVLVEAQTGYLPQC